MTLFKFYVLDIKFHTSIVLHLLAKCFTLLVEEFFYIFQQVITLLVHYIKKNRQNDYVISGYYITLQTPKSIFPHRPRM